MRRAGRPVRHAARALLVLGLSALLLGLAPVASAEPVEVELGIYVLTLGNHDVNKGTYVMDFYLVLRWNASAAPASFTPEKFEFMNGRASAKERIFDATDETTGVRETWYRVQANLYAEPTFKDYPYDTQHLSVVLEDPAANATSLVYVPMESMIGLDDGFRAAGWRVGEPVFTISDKDYRFGETYSRASLTLDLSRERVSTSVKSLLPPVAFMVVSGLSFFIHPTKWANRVGLGTGMLISAVMFHVSQTVSLPPLGHLILFDKIMIAVYAFLVGSLIVTVLVAIDEDWWKESDHTRQINVYGAAATILLSGSLLVLLIGL